MSTRPAPERFPARRLPIRAYLVRAAVVSCVLGLFIGSLLGVLASWLAGAAVQWLLQLSFTTGVDVELLPFGDRYAALQTLSERWYLVIPLTAVATALLGGLVGLLAGLLLAAVDQWLGPPTYVLVEASEVPHEAGVTRRMVAAGRRSRPLRQR